MFKNINFEPGEVVYNGLDFNIEVPLKEQLFSLKEDLFQVNYYDKYLIDVGWYPEFDEAGSFNICIVENYNWSDLIFQKKCKEIKQLNQYMLESVNLINKLLKGK
ncbi:hypothetical protein [Rummeliibacillus pycnus]|uniref:hypothetical protein n=1 Tax=Rummeliibacillus pycnus TaxID=101070 RepID=UPI003D26D3E4